MECQRFYHLFYCCCQIVGLKREFKNGTHILDQVLFAGITKTQFELICSSIAYKIISYVAITAWKNNTTKSLELLQGLFLSLRVYNP